jgi:hypothetical protein
MKQVVDKDSAVFDSEKSENIPMARDHEHLVRFESAHDDAFHTLCQTLQRKVSKILETTSKSTQESTVSSISPFRSHVHMLAGC